MKTLKQVVAAALVLGAMTVAMSASAAGLKEVQAALNQLYPEWTASNVGDISNSGNRDCGLHDGVISIHPLSTTAPATLTRVGPITGAHPVLHLRVASVAANKNGDWVLKGRVNGQQFFANTTIASTAVKDFKFPLAAWANKGDVKIELDNAAGGGANWNWELGFWHLIEIVDDPSAYANECQAIVQTALDEKFPGWTVVGESASVNTQIGLNGNAVVTHPFENGTPVLLTRTVELTGTNPMLVVKVASYQTGNTTCDWQFAAEINREIVIPRQEIRTQQPVEFRYPLARWLGQGPIEIRLFNWNGGTHNAWSCEWAFWHQIDIVDAPPTGEPALRFSYLKGQGRQFINTGYLTQYTSVFDAKLWEPWRGQATSYTTVFAGGSYNDFGAIGFWDRSGGKFNATFGLAQKGIGGGAFPREKWVDLTVDVSNALATWSTEGQETPSTIAGTSGTLDCIAPVFIFTRDDFAGTTSNQMTANTEFSLMRLHEFRIREGETQKLNLVPYRRADGLKGLLDELTGTFYPNVGSGEFDVGGLGYTLDGTRLIVHEGEMMPFDFKPTYTAIEKVGTNEVTVSRIPTLPSLTVTEGTLSFAGGEARTYTVNGALTVAGGATLAFGVGTTGCDAVTATELVLSGVDAEHPVNIVLKPAGASALAAGAVCPLLALGEDQRNLAFFRLQPGLPVVLDIRDGQLVAVPTATTRTLPVGYTPISCIRSTGTQFISTGIAATSDTVVEMTFSGLKPVVDTALFGMDTWSNNDYLVDILAGGLYLYGHPDGTLILPLADFDALATYQLSIAGGWLYFNPAGEPQRILEDENDLSSAQNKELFLFGINNATPRRSSYSLASFKILTANGERLRDYQPCRTPDGEAGLWDHVEGVFYGNEGTGHFFGPDEEGLTLNYIRSSGTQYIKTGFDAQTNTKLEMDFGQVVAQASAGNNGAIFGKGAWSDKCYLLDILNGKLSFWGNGAYPGYTKDSAPVIAPNDRYLVRVADGKVTLRTNGGDPLSSSDVNDISKAQTGDLTLFGLSTGQYRSTYSLYSCKLWDGAGTLVRDLMPWRNDDGRVGLIDRTGATAGTFYGNSGAGEFAYGYAYTADGDKISIHDGTVTADDDLTAYTEVEKVGWYELLAGEKTSYPGALTIAKGAFSLVNGAPATTTVAGTLTLTGATKLCFDLTATGSDTLSANSVALVDATAETPIRIQLALGENIDFSRPFTLIASGLPSDALASFTLVDADDLPFSLALDNGALVLRYNDPTVPVVSVWTNGFGDHDLTNPGNWASTNGLGQAIAAIPAANTLVRLPDGCVFNCPTGASFAYSELVLPASIGGDCDWTGLPVPIDTTIDLCGHNLRLSNLNGTGTITDSTGGAYQRLDYLQTDGTAYINTGYAHKYNTRVDIEVAFHVFPGLNLYRCFFGARTAAFVDDQFGGWVHTKADGTAVYYSAVSAAEKDTTFGLALDTRYRVHLDCDGPCTINGETFDSGVYGANSLVDYLFAINEANKPNCQFAQARIYSCKIYTGDTLERDFVPVRRIADGVLGLLDQAHDVFYPNSHTSGTFYAGDVDPTGQTGGTVLLEVPEGQTLTSGTLAFTGCAKLLKEGAGTLVWAQGTMASSASAIVTNGVFRFALSTQAAASTAFGASGAFKVAGKGQLDINGLVSNYTYSPVYSRTLFLEGDGPDGTGALVSTSSLSIGGNSVGRVVLTGDTTIGGTQRVDISGAKAEVDGRDYTLTIKNWPYFVKNNGTALNVRAIDVVGHADIAFNDATPYLTATEGLNLRGGNFSSWSSKKGDVVFPKDLAVNVGAEGGNFFIYSNSGSATIPGPLTVKEGGTFTVDAANVTFGNVSNQTGCTFQPITATTGVTFSGRLHNDGLITQELGTINYTTNALVTGSGMIEMTGGTASLAADVSGFTGTLRLVDGTLTTGLGTFANCTVIDVSARTDTFDVAGKNWNVIPAGSRVKIDLGERRIGGGLKVLAWPEAPTGVKFASANGKVYSFIVKDDGLYVYSGLMFILR